MISSEVQRTLVKSPPELWAELSDPAALARHLGELGEIRITRTEPEKTVVWEAENTTGTVSIRPSGWGTRVTLSVTKEIVGAAAEPADAELAEAPAEPEAPVAPAADAAAGESQPDEPRRGFFARLFGRKRKADAQAHRPSEDVSPPSQPEPAGEPSPAELAAPHEPHTGQQPDAQPEQIADLAAELRAAEEVAEEEVTAVLAAVLDRLGAAHHRPFSRS